MTSPGLQALRDSLEADHEVWTVAPDGERSGTSHMLTLKNPIKCVRVDERSFETGGSPADCVILGLLGALPNPPDIVISGINIGPNLGTDVVYSGTAAAARQASFMGVPGVAVSLNGYTEPLHFSYLADFVAERLEAFHELWDEHHFININGPNTHLDDPETRITRPSRRIYQDRILNYTAPNGDTYFFLDGAPQAEGHKIETDAAAVSDGAVSVSPVSVHPVGYDHRGRYEQRLLSTVAGG
jgi:5'-nucleotidase